MPLPNLAGQPVLELRAVSKSFKHRDGSTQQAVASASLSVHAGETVALVGESGSGKTTLSRIALALTRPDSGDVLLRGTSLVTIDRRELRRVRTAMQPVFQDSSAAFNPRYTVAQALGIALSLSSGMAAKSENAILSLLTRVNLKPAASFLNRFPHELSGGQRQRLSIARAIAMNPVLIVADEPLSGSDVSIRGEVLNLLLDLQASQGMAYLFVTHDMSVARAFAHRIAVMHNGILVEEGLAADIIERPAHPYTRRLVSAGLQRHAPAEPGAARPAQG